MTIKTSVRRLVGAVGVAFVALGIMATPSSAATITCTTSVSYEVDGFHGTVILYPKARCNNSFDTLTITSWTPAQEKSVTYKKRAAGTYAGVGLSLPRNSADEYCIVVRADWIYYPDNGGTVNTHCVYL